MENCFVHCSDQQYLHGLYATKCQSASPPHNPVVTTKNVFRHCQMSFGRTKLTRVENHSSLSLSLYLCIYISHRDVAGAGVIDFLRHSQVYVLRILNFL